MLSLIPYFIAGYIFNKFKKIFWIITGLYLFYLIILWILYPIEFSSSVSDTIENKNITNDFLSKLVAYAFGDIICSLVPKPYGTKK